MERILSSNIQNPMLRSGLRGTENEVAGHQPFGGTPSIVWWHSTNRLVALHRLASPLRRLSAPSFIRVAMMLFACLSVLQLSAQNDRDYVRRGNRLMRDTVPERLQENAPKAQVQYQKAIEYDNTNAIAHYNLGNALLNQNKAEEAMKEYDTATRFERDKGRRAKMFHNMGVVMQGAKQFDKAVAFYRESLRNDPTNDETRYNYALSLYQLKKQQQQGGGESENKDENGQDEKKEQDKQQQQEQQKQEKPDEQKQEQQQPEPNQMSKENAEQLLNAAMQDEKDTQDKLQKALAKPQQKRLQKQW